MEQMILSTLPKTWFIDLDGTILIHNGYKDNGEDTFLEGAKEYLCSLPEDDFIIFVSSRSEEYREVTIDFLKHNGIRYNSIIFGVPMGERIVLNDRKPSGIDMAFSINFDRNHFKTPDILRVL